MNDVKFLSHLNRLSREHRFTMPVFKAGEAPSEAFLAQWARFLEACVKEGVALSDTRWQRISLVAAAPVAQFGLDPSDEGRSDPDFRVGLQLLMGLLEPKGPETPLESDDSSEGA